MLNEWVIRNHWIRDGECWINGSLMSKWWFISGYLLLIRVDEYIIKGSPINVSVMVHSCFMMVYWRVIEASSMVYCFFPFKWTTGLLDIVGNVRSINNPPFKPDNRSLSPEGLEIVLEELMPHLNMLINWHYASCQECLLDIENVAHTESNGAGISPNNRVSIIISVRNWHQPKLPLS